MLGTKPARGGERSSRADPGEGLPGEAPPGEAPPPSALIVPLTLPREKISRKRIKGEIWEKWGATYGRNGCGGRKKYLATGARGRGWEDGCLGVGEGGGGGQREAGRGGACLRVSVRACGRARARVRAFVRLCVCACVRDLFCVCYGGQLFMCPSPFGPLLFLASFLASHLFDS